jgi:hypothetical protein
VLLALNLSVTLSGCSTSSRWPWPPDQFAVEPGLDRVPQSCHSLVTSLVMSLIALAVSSLSRSARGRPRFFGLVFGLEILRGVLRAYDRRSPRSSSRPTCSRWERALRDHGPRLPAPVGPIALVLTAVSLGCLAILRARVRAVEIVR